MERKINYFTNIQSALCLLFVFLLVGLSACKSDDDADSQAQLKIESFYPNSGKGGTLVTIKGAGFNANMNGNAVEFSGVKAEVFSAKENELVVLAPTSGKTGTIRINNGKQSLDVGTYTYQNLSVQRISPANGPTGTNIRISGEGFSSLDEPAKVQVNGKEAVVVNVSDTLIVAKVPAEAGKGSIKVLVDGKESTGPTFIYQEITDIKPKTGGKGTKITISGQGFDTELANNLLYFNNIQGKVLAVTDTKLVVEAPDNVATSKVALIVNKQKTVGPEFKVVPPPTISVVAPLSGPVGSKITITGAGFSAEEDENRVFLSGTEIPLDTYGSSGVSFTLPTGVATGKLVVIVNDQKTIGPEFKNQNLGIVKVTPESGLAGTVVTIEGTGFNSDMSQNKVTFNGVAAKIDYSMSTKSKLVVTAPDGLKTGTLKIEAGNLVAEAPKTFNRSGIMTLAGGPDSNDLSYNISKIVVDANKNVFVATKTQIFKISPEGSVSAFVGSTSYGNDDGVGTAAQFSSISGMVIDKKDNIYVAEYDKMRKVTSSAQVTTLGISVREGGSITLDPSGKTLYVSASYMGIYKYNNGYYTRVFGMSVDNDCRPAVDANGTVYFGYDPYESYLKRYQSTDPYPSKWLGSYSSDYVDGPFSSACFQYGISALLFDLENNLLIMDRNNYAIRKADLAKQEVSTVVRSAGGRGGYVDGDFSKAKWGYGVSDMAIDKDGDIYIVDPNNKAVRKIFLK